MCPRLRIKVPLFNFCKGNGKICLLLVFVDRVSRSRAPVSLTLTTTLLPELASTEKPNKAKRDANEATEFGTVNVTFDETDSAADVQHNVFQ